MIRWPKIDLYSNETNEHIDNVSNETNEHIDNVSFIVKSFITIYLIHYHKKTFHNELFLSVYSILQME